MATLFQNAQKNYMGVSMVGPRGEKEEMQSAVVEETRNTRTIRMQLACMDVFVVQFASTEEGLGQFRQAVNVQKTVRHPNVVPILGASFRDGDQTLNQFVTPAYEKTLEKAIAEDSLSYVQKLQIVADVAAALAWMHSVCKVVHRNVKPASIYLDKNNRAHLGNFVYSQFIPRIGTLRDTVCIKGSPVFMAPELFRRDAFTEKIDIYAFGLTVYQLFSGAVPFSGLCSSLPDLIHLVCVDRALPDMSCFVHDQRVKQMIECCCAWNQESRPKAEKIYKYVTSL